jgi:hypothetical protein
VIVLLVVFEAVLAPYSTTMRSPTTGGVPPESHLPLPVSKAMPVPRGSLPSDRMPVRVLVLLPHSSLVPPAVPFSVSVMSVQRVSVVLSPCVT